MLTVKIRSSQVRHGALLLGISRQVTTVGFRNMVENFSCLFVVNSKHLRSGRVLGIDFNFDNGRYTTLGPA